MGCGGWGAGGLADGWDETGVASSGVVVGVGDVLGGGG